MFGGGAPKRKKGKKMAAADTDCFDNATRDPAEANALVRGGVGRIAVYYSVLCGTRTSPDLKLPTPQDTSLWELHALKSPYGNEYDAETGRAGLLKRDSYYHTWGQGTGIN